MPPIKARQWLLRAVPGPVLREYSSSRNVGETLAGFLASPVRTLVRYVARPAFSQGRLKLRSDGKVKWTLRRPWRDGTRAFVFESLVFLERLAALVPHPREHGWTYHGSLAPAASAPSGDCDAAARRRTWAELLERVFAEDVLRFPRCGGRRHHVAATAHH